MSCFSDMFDRHFVDSNRIGIEDIRDAAEMAYGSKNGLVGFLTGVLRRNNVDELESVATILRLLPCGNNSLSKLLHEALTTELNLSPYTHDGYAGRFKELIEFKRLGKLPEFLGWDKEG